MIPLALAALAASAAPVVVSPLRTEQLAENCRGKDRDTDLTFCTGFIIGVFDTLSLTHQVCPSPDRFSTAEVVADARRYLRAHRRQWSSAPSFVIRDALQAAFPCARRGAGCGRVTP